MASEPGSAEAGHKIEVKVTATGKSGKKQALAGDVPLLGKQTDSNAGVVVCTSRPGPPLGLPVGRINPILTLRAHTRAAARRGGLFGAHAPRRRAGT